MDSSFSSSMSGSDLEQIVHNKIGRLSLEWVEIWNKGLWWKSVVVSYNAISSLTYLHDHMKPKHKLKIHQKMFHYCMLVTKESNNKTYDINTIYFMWKEPICIK